MRANVKTHLVHPHERAEARALSDVQASRSRAHTRVQDSYGATNDWNDLHSMSNRRSLSVFLRSPSSCPSRASLSLSLPHSLSSTRRSARRSSSPSGSRSGYLLRGRCGLNLINSMRHLDKCAPRTRIQRIIFILIHLSLLSIPGLSPSSRPIPHLVLRSFSSPLTVSPRADPRHGRSNRFFGYQIPDSYSSSASTLRAGAGGWVEGDGGEKRTHLSAPISPGSFVFLMSRRI